MKDKPRIYNYFDYRDFLKDFFSFKKSLKISMRKMAKELGVSNAYLTMVLNRKRNLDLKYLDSFGDLAGMNVSERSYFKNLILLSDSENTETRSQAFKALSKFSSYRNEKKQDVTSHKYLEKWYFVAIRELSFLPDFKEEPEWIQKRFLPGLKQREIEEALAFLKKQGLLSNKSDQGLNCSENIYKLSLTNFHQEMLSIAADSIVKVKRDRRSILGFTKAMSKKNFQRASEIMQKALGELEQLQEEEHGAELYHFYLLGFPLTQKDKK